MQSINRPHVSVSCIASSGMLRERALTYAGYLDLPFSDPCDATYDMTLVLTDTRLELRSNRFPGKSAPGALYVDFLSGRTGYRHRHNATIKQPLARAVGIRHGFRPFIVDATAGLGQDGFVFSCLGCNVLMIERSPILHALIDDGLQRARTDPTVAKIVEERLRLVAADARTFLTGISPQPYTVYLDPMYPHRQSSALNKKEMRIIRDLVGDDEDSAALLDVALSAATNRVVVKRPKEAPPLADRRPSHTVPMTSSRFDVYLANRQ